MKPIRLGRRTVNIDGVSDSDPYYLSLSDGSEDGFAKFCQVYLREEDIALDIGANIGITTILLSQQLSRGHIHAFEPGPAVFSILERNITTNKLKNVTAHNLAISDKSGLIKFTENSAYGHISDEGDHEVRTTTIDELVETLSLERLDFIKIDVEGFEEAVLKGAVNTIQKFQPLIYVEFNSWCLTAYSKSNPIDFAQWLLDTFSSVSLVAADGDANSMLRRLEKDGAVGLVHNNMVFGGCVNDLVITNDGNRIQKTPFMLAAALDRVTQERDDALSQRDAALAEKDAALAEKDAALSRRSQGLAAPMYNITKQMKKSLLKRLS